MLLESRPDLSTVLLESRSRLSAVLLKSCFGLSSLLLSIQFPGRLWSLELRAHLHCTAIGLGGRGVVSTKVGLSLGSVIVRRISGEYCSRAGHQRLASGHGWVRDLHCTAIDLCGRRVVSAMRDQAFLGTVSRVVQLTLEWYTSVAPAQGYLAQEERTKNLHCAAINLCGRRVVSAVRDQAVHRQ